MPWPISRFSAATFRRVAWALLPTAAGFLGVGGVLRGADLVLVRVLEVVRAFLSFLAIHPAMQEDGLVLGRAQLRIRASPQCLGALRVLRPCFGRAEGADLDGREPIAARTPGHPVLLPLRALGVVLDQEGALRGLDIAYRPALDVEPIGGPVLPRERGEVPTPADDAGVSDEDAILVVRLPPAQLPSHLTGSGAVERIPRGEAGLGGAAKDTTDGRAGCGTEPRTVGHAEGGFETALVVPVVAAPGSAFPLLGDGTRRGFHHVEVGGRVGVVLC